VDDFKELLPLVQELGNPALQPRHWQDVFDIIGADIPTNESGIGEYRHGSQHLVAFSACATLHAVQAHSLCTYLPVP
jgi:dynein heavy chain